MATRLKDTFTLPAKFWNRVAVYAIATIKKRTQNGFDRDGKRFPNYTKSYADRKKKGFRRLDGKRSKQYAGQSLERQTQPPNFRLRGHTMRGLHRIAQTPDSVVIGWQNEAATIVAGHEDKRKYKVGGITDKEHDFIIELADKELERQWNDARAVNLTVRF